MKNFGYIKSKLNGTEKEYNIAQAVPNEFRYKLPEVFNQGNLPICTACASHAFLNWNWNKNFDLNTIFKNSKPEKEGAELKNVFEYLKKEKLIDSYAMVKSMLALKTAILLNGPCVAALPVYSENYDFWNGDSYKGGHAIAIVGWNDEGFIIRNSWGKSWGDNGYTILPYEDMNKFFEIWTLIK